MTDHIKIHDSFTGSPPEIKPETENAVNSCILPYKILIIPDLSGSQIVDILFGFDGEEAFPIELFIIRCNQEHTNHIIQIMSNIKSLTTESTCTLEDLACRGTTLDNIFTLLVTTRFDTIGIMIRDLSRLEDYLANSSKWQRKLTVNRVMRLIGSRLIALIGPVRDLVNSKSLTSSIEFTHIRNMTFEMRTEYANDFESVMVSVRIMEPIHCRDFVHILVPSIKADVVSEKIKSCLEKIPDGDNDKKSDHGRLCEVMPSGVDGKMTIRATKGEIFHFVTYTTTKSDSIAIAIPIDNHNERECNIFVNLMLAIDINADIRKIKLSPATPSPRSHLYLPYILLGVGIVGLILALRRSEPVRAHLIGWIALIIIAVLRIFR